MLIIAMALAVMLFAAGLNLTVPDSCCYITAQPPNKLQFLWVQAKQEKSPLSHCGCTYHRYKQNFATI